MRESLHHQNDLLTMSRAAYVPLLLLPKRWLILFIHTGTRLTFGEFACNQVIKGKDSFTGEI